jgi:Pectate lyase superfamily protein
MPNKSIPQLGDSNWGTPLNAHISQLQNPTNGGINTFEQFSYRPTNLTADDAGRTYLYTQTGNLHQWTGTNWKVLNESVINVKDYGAVGDGVADDTAAIQSCFGTVADTFKSVYLSNGTYKITNKIKVPNAVKINGESRFGTVILNAGNNWTIEPIGGPWTFEIGNLTIKGGNPDYITATAKGINSNPASHNYLLTNVIFRNLVQVIEFQYSWTGKMENVYVYDCGNLTKFAITVNAETNGLNINNLQIQGETDWKGKGLYIGNGGLGGYAGCFNTNIYELSLENIKVPEAAVFADSSMINIYGGYWEQHTSLDDNKVICNSPVKMHGVQVGVVVDVNVPVDQVIFDGCNFFIPNQQGSLINCAAVDKRNIIPISTTNTTLPIIETSGGTKNKNIVKSFDNSNLGTFAITPDIANYYGNAHSLSIVNDGIFNSKSLTFTNVTDEAFGGAIGLDISKILPINRSDLYGWAIIKQIGEGQTVLSLGGPDSNDSNKIIFRNLNNKGWNLLYVGPQSKYDNYLWIRLYGANGGAPTPGTKIIIDSFGVSTGKLDT